MLIKQIDILVHPDYFQMSLPGLPLHKKQLLLREKWEQRLELLEKQQDAILLHFSFMFTRPLKLGIEGMLTTQNVIQKEEIRRTKNSMEKLGNRYFWFGCFIMPDSDSLNEMFKSRDFTYVPQDTKIRGYGEMFEVCTKAWVDGTALSLGIPPSNIEYCRDESLTNSDGIEINKWRMNLF